MPCLLVAVAWFFPRLLMVFIYLLTDWFARAYQTWYWPLLGFFFLPYTTLAYMAAQLQAGALEGWWIALFILAVIFDIGGQSGSTHKRSRKR